MSRYVRDPDSILDYAWDWTTWLDGDTITGHTVTTPTVPGQVDPLVIDSTSSTGQVVTVWVSGGTAGRTDPVTCRIVTAGGRTDERTMFLAGRER